ncbi:hypothetical protein, partial [Pediococcus acidilactici]
FGKAPKIKKTKLRKTKNHWGFDFNKIKTCARSQFVPPNQKDRYAKLRYNGLFSVNARLFVPLSIIFTVPSRAYCT